VQVIDSVTAIATFLMVFLLQNAQNQDASAKSLNLNELIRAVDAARSHMIDIKRLSYLELDELQATYERIKALPASRQFQKPTASSA
jgi:low affinity Fe/Cu permease